MFVNRNGERWNLELIMGDSTRIVVNARNEEENVDVIINYNNLEEMFKEWELVRNCVLYPVVDGC